MNKEITLIARLIAVFSALAFTVLLALTIIAVVSQRQFLRPDPYLSALEDVGAYERAPLILSELFMNILDESRSGLAGRLPLPEVNQSDVELFLTSFLPRDWVQTQTDVVVRYLLADLNDEPPPQPAVLSMAGLKEQLTGAAGSQALLAVIETRPACGVTDLSALTCGFNLAGEIACRPPALNMELCGVALGVATGGIAALLPDEVSLQTVLEVGTTLTGSLRADVRRYVGAISLLARFGWLAAIPLLLSLTIFGVRSLVGWLRWWGAPLLGAALGLVPAIAITIVSPTWYLGAFLTDLAPAAPGVAQLMGDVARSLSRGFVLQLVVAAVVLGATGAGMLALSFIVPFVQRWMNQGSSTT